MAQRIEVRLVDDLDGAELSKDNGQTVTFALDGISYEIDLSNDNAQKMRADLGKYVNAGRKLSETRSSSRRAPRKLTQHYDIAAVKAWADSHHKDYPKRGRLPQRLIDDYKAAGN